jgi:hypothetical protein
MVKCLSAANISEHKELFMQSLYKPNVFLFQTYFVFITLTIKYPFFCLNHSDHHVTSLYFLAGIPGAHQL